jgi:hypothetical protein
MAAGISKSALTLPKVKHLKASASLPSAERKELKNALVVFRQAEQAADKFFAVFQQFRQGSKGTSSHGEQDLLRAMLVFACSGLDAVVKQLVRDALPSVIDKDEGARLQFQKFIERKLKKGGDEKDRQLDTGLIASVMAGRDPKKQLYDLLRADLTADSLQSKDQLLKVASYFAIQKDEVIKADDATKEAFAARNQIIHEMDVHLDGQKKRRQRATDKMVSYSETILAIAVDFLIAVEGKLK